MQEIFAVEGCEENCVKHSPLYENHATVYCAKHNFLWLLKYDNKLEKTTSYISFLFRKYLKEAKKNWSAMKRKEKILTEKICKLRSRLYQRNRLTFGSLRCFQKDPVLKIFFHDITKINVPGP